ncbi:hypothetical protein HWC21_gp140 [Vibrio phage VAP7]|uniref:Uncharacterized protein n=1 Tax=Vibrio phage VAP7 TaxID=2584487 RepID=A0A4Y5TVD6_9CAUD|nr:hypothetical protein HWC21_gp140 [Vibrio phage VAP7]QDB73322.1 hypothetical protein [Vibrio phage VAP7]UFD98186.1 hypothetical protein [Vibrio phage BX-1]
MTLHVRAEGAYKDGEELYQRVNGVYVKVESLHERVNGAYINVFSHSAGDFPAPGPNQIEFGYRPLNVKPITGGWYGGNILWWMNAGSGFTPDDHENVVAQIQYTVPVGKKLKLERFRFATNEQNELVKMAVYEVTDLTARTPTTLIHTVDINIGDVPTEQRPKFIEVDTSLQALYLEAGKTYGLGIIGDGLSLPEQSTSSGAGLLKYTSPDVNPPADLSAATADTSWYILPFSVLGTLEDV